MPEYPKIKATKIPYDSPSGSVYVGKYIPPFEKVKKGFGFKGVILEDSESGKLQCHICGEWLHIFNSHLSKHNINSNDYRKKFGLSRSTALKSKKIRLRQSVVMQKLMKEHPEKFNNRFSNNGFKKGNSYAGNMKNKKKSAETINKYGICELQIIDRILKLKEKLNKTPTLTDLKDEYGGGFIFHIHKRYGSYLILCDQINLKPNFSNRYPKYSKEYFIKKALSKEASIKILTQSEGRNIYRYFKGGVKEWKSAVKEYKSKNKLL